MASTSEVAALLRRPSLLAAIALALLPIHAQAGEVTVEELARGGERLARVTGRSDDTKERATDRDVVVHDEGDQGQAARAARDPARRRRPVRGAHGRGLAAHRGRRRLHESARNALLRAFGYGSNSDILRLFFGVRELDLRHADASLAQHVRASPESG